MVVCERNACDQAGQHPSMSGEGKGLTPARLRSYCQFMAAGRGRVGFLYRCGPWQVDHTLVDDPTSVKIEATKHLEGWERKGTDLGGVR